MYSPRALLRHDPAGKEFAIILEESSAQEAFIRGNALRTNGENMRLQYKRQTLRPLSLSGGIAAFPEHALTSDNLLKTARQCLCESNKPG